MFSGLRADLKGGVATPRPLLCDPIRVCSHQSEMINSEGTGFLLAHPFPEALSAPGSKEAFFFFVIKL